MKRTVQFAGKLARVSFTAAIDVQPLVAGRGKAPEPVWDGHYKLSTKNRDENEILAEINRLEMHHEKKSARMTGFQPLIGEYMEIAGDMYLWTDCAIRERGPNVELYVSVWDPWGKRAKGMPLRLVYPTVDDVPTNEEIEQLIRERIASVVAKEMAHEQKIARVEAMLAGGE